MNCKRFQGYLASPAAIRACWNAFADELGEKALIHQIRRGVEEYATSPASAIARLHHYFFVPAHRKYLEDGLERLKLGTFGDSPEWARHWVKRWLQREVESGLQHTPRTC